MQLGVRTLHSGDVTAAAVAFAAATSHLPERPEAWVNLAVAKLNLADPQGATAAINTALQAHSDYAPALSCMGDIQRTLGALEEAAGWYHKALAINPEPVGLNNLATLTRTLGDAKEAERLYLEAEQLAPQFTLPRVNRAIMQIELQRFEEAKQQLTALNDASLNPQEREHQQSALLSLVERERLEAPLGRLVESGDSQELEVALRATPSAHLEVDRHALEPIEKWLAELAAASIDIEPVPLSTLPSDWCEIEAAHMIPVVASAREFRGWQAQPDTLPITELERHQTARMIPAIEIARAAPLELTDPVRAETQLRQIHALSTADVALEGLFPGRFKYTQTSARNHPTARHVIPSRAAGTFRSACDLLNHATPGLGRAVTLFMTVVSLHPFADGNGRVGMTLMNRELIACGLMPAIFSLELGPKGLLGEAEEYAYQQGSILPMLEAVVAGQCNAQAFLQQLADFDAD
jgi:tetratricopeptide (TPR) repeat protein